jgi:hypothetical protein
MLEYESVLTRPGHFAACAASREDVSAVLDELASFGKRVELMIRTRPMLPDPNDEMVLETAINGRADAIVTFNERDFRPVAARFRCSVGAARGNRYRAPSFHWKADDRERWWSFWRRPVDNSRYRKFSTSMMSLLNASNWV